MSDTFIRKFVAAKFVPVTCKGNSIRNTESIYICPLLTGTRAQCQRAFSASQHAGCVRRRSCANFTLMLWGDEKLTADVIASSNSFTRINKKSGKPKGYRGRETVSTVLCGVIINSLINFRSALRIAA